MPNHIFRFRPSVDILHPGNWAMTSLEVTSRAETTIVRFLRSYVLECTNSINNLSSCCGGFSGQRASNLLPVSLPSRQYNEINQPNSNHVYYIVSVGEQRMNVLPSLPVLKLPILVPIGTGPTKHRPRPRSETRPRFKRGESASNDWADLLLGVPLKRDKES